MTTVLENLHTLDFLYVTAVKFPTLSPTPPDQSAKYKEVPLYLFFPVNTFIYLFLHVLSKIQHDILKRKRQGQPIHAEAICSDMKAVLVHGSESLFSATV